MTRRCERFPWVLMALGLAMGACKASVTTPVVVAVDQVTMSPGTLTLVVGGQQTLTATPMGGGQALSGRTVTWSSGNAAIASVGAGGQVTAVSAGNTAITATSEGINGTAQVAVSNPAPTISAIAPTTAAATSPAFILTVTGTGFVTGTTVQWNGGAVPTTVVSSIQLTAGIPAADLLTAGAAAVTVLTPGLGGGTTGAMPFAISAAPNPAPTLTSLAPSSAAAGGAAFTLTLNGTNFVAASQAMWNGNARTTTFVSATQLHMAILGADIGATGTAQLTVVNPTPGGGTSAAVPFSVTQAAPTITTVSPILALAGGVAFTATVTGTNFVAGSVVQWNGQGRTTTFVSATQVTAQITAADITAAGTGLVTVQVPGGAVSAAQSIAILGPANTVGINGRGCAISSSNALYCWGDNRYGGVGDGSATQVDLVPVHVATGLTFSSVAMGIGGSCALATGGGLYCWGPDDGVSNGGTISNSPAPSVTPARVAASLSFVSISRGAYDVCGITADGHAYCWGTNSYGEDGDATTSTNATPVLVQGGQTFVVVSVGAYQSCGLVAGGAAWCWGRNESGELGNGATADSHVPVPVAGGHTFVAISAGNPTCAIDRNGASWCWGDNSSGALGNGSTTNSAVPVAVTNGLIFSSISVSTYPGSTSLSYACGITTSAAAYCWGNNLYGQLGNGTDAATLVPIPVAGGFTFAALSAGYGNACGITTVGVAVCWGLRAFGDLGNGTIGYRNLPTPVTGGLSFTTLSIGEKHGCGLVTAGDVYCWGDGSVGELGNGANLGSPSPVKVAGGHHFVSLGATSGRVTCAIASDSLPPTAATYCWGSNAMGELGHGTLEASDNVPVLVAGGLNFQSVSSSDDVQAQGYSTTCAVTTTGVGYCWGYNGSGQLGNGTFASTPNPTPVPVLGGLVFSSITPGGDHSCGVAVGGAAWCWGDDQLGELGLGRVGNGTQGTPQAVVPPVTGPVTFTSLSAAFGKTCGVTVPVAIYCWGWRTPTGAGPVTYSKPLVLEGYMAVQIDGTGSCVLSLTNITDCWDHNENGEQGIGTFQTVSGWQDFADVLGGLRFQSIYVGGNAVCGLVSSGAAYCWGSNNYGILGVGETDHVTQPTAVSGGIPFLAPHLLAPGMARIVRR